MTTREVCQGHWSDVLGRVRPCEGPAEYRVGVIRECDCPNNVALSCKEHLVFANGVRGDCSACGAVGAIQLAEPVPIAERPIYDAFDHGCLHAQTHVPDTAGVGYCLRCERPYADEAERARDERLELRRQVALDEADDARRLADPTGALGGIDLDEAPDPTGEDYA